MFRVHIRKKKISKGQLSLYLDFSRPVYHEIKGRNTRREFLGLFLYERPKTNIQKKHNTAMTELAEVRQAEVLLAIANGTYGKRTDDEKSGADFLAFFLERAGTRKGTTKETWMSTYRYLAKFTDGKCTVGEVTKDFLFRFKDFLDEQRLKNGRELKNNSKRAYFAKMRQAVKEAAERGLMPADVEVKNYKSLRSRRPFLTDQQVRKLKATPYPAYPDLRRAALFSIMTSLRWSDLLPLTHEQVQHDPKMKHFIDFKQKKVDRPDILYLSEEALALCGYEEGKKGRMFPLQKWDKSKIRAWFKLAGVDLPPGIEFHIFRHTFAMRELNKGTPIEVISAMMGHRDIKTTQIYAQLYAETKRDALHRVTLD